MSNHVENQSRPCHIYKGRSDKQGLSPGFALLTSFRNAECGMRPSGDLRCPLQHNSPPRPTSPRHTCPAHHAAARRQPRAKLSPPATHWPATSPASSATSHRQSDPRTWPAVPARTARSHLSETRRPGPPACSGGTASSSRAPHRPFRSPPTMRPPRAARTRPWSRPRWQDPREARGP